MYSYSTFYKEHSFKDDVSITAIVFRNLTLINFLVALVMMLFLWLVGLFIVMLPGLSASFAAGWNSSVGDELANFTAPRYFPLWVNILLFVTLGGYFIYRIARTMLYGIKLIYFRFSNFNLKRPGLMTVAYMVGPSLIQLLLFGSLILAALRFPASLPWIVPAVDGISVAVYSVTLVALLYLSFSPRAKSVEEKDGQIGIEHFAHWKLTSITAFVVAALGVGLGALSIVLMIVEGFIK